MTTSSSSIRVGIVGMGSMGVNHARHLQEGKIPGAQLAAISDVLPANLEPWKEVAKFESGEALIASGKVDAVVIVTPHFSHAPLTIAALNAGLHALVEKPLTVKKSDGEKMI